MQQRHVAKLWKVAGGKESGGILVREGRELQSASKPERLSTGATVRELELAAGRLKYELVQGTGPSDGWVSLKVSGKELIVPLSEEELVLQERQLPEFLKVADEFPTAACPELPQQLRPACSVFAPGLKAVDILGPFSPASGIKNAKDKANLRLTGDLYKLPLPRNQQELESAEYGAAWLTKAFHAAGTLPENNRVDRITSARNFPGGGAGPKTLLAVEYALPDAREDAREALHAALFIKFPAEVGATGSGVSSAQQRMRDMQGAYGDIWGAEVQFYRFVSPFVPFPVPKYYFGDVNRESHEAIVITAAIDWPQANQKALEAHQVLPPCEKCEDYNLRSSQDYYFALLRRLGTLAGLQKVGKLGPDTDRITWSPAGPDLRDIPDMTPHLQAFVQDVAPQIWPDSVKSAQFWRLLKMFGPMFQKHGAAFQQYLYSNPLYVGFSHQNGNTDNAYFYRDSGGVLECGILDWGSAGHMAYASEFMGAFGSCLAEMLAEYDDLLIRAFADAYHETGAPAVDVDELIVQYRVAMSASTFQMMATCLQFISERHPLGKPFWKDVKQYTDDKIRSDFGTKFTVSMLYNKVVLMSLRGEAYCKSMQDWVKRACPT